MADDSLNPPSGNQVFVNIANGPSGNRTHYYSTGNSSDRVQVYMNNGKVAVKGTGIHLVNIQNASDNGTLDFDVTQTN
ncbi:MAG: hypothetical protein JST76_15465 [Bacteroidetes bacterium]|nr:hypothetical protein [Bacteroidota bacterium]